MTNRRTRSATIPAAKKFRGVFRAITALQAPGVPCKMPGMKLAVSLAAVLIAATGCEKAPSKIEKEAESAKGQMSSGVGTGSLETRVAKLEKYTEALDFLQKVYDQQKAAQEQQEASQPDPDAVFAVDVSKALAAGQVEGPANALVTIVEAWDFA